MPTVAAIDVGSIAIRLLIANANANGGHETILSTREPVRLGQDVFTKGLISAHTIERTLQTFQGFKEKLDEHAVKHVKAVGSSALPGTTNRDVFLKKIAKNTGIEISGIGGEEEARLEQL